MGEFDDEAAADDLEHEQHAQLGRALQPQNGQGLKIGPIGISVFVFIALVVLLIYRANHAVPGAASASSAGVPLSTGDSVSPQAPSSTSAPYQIGQPITQSGYQIVLTRAWQPTAVGNGLPEEPPANSSFVAVDFAIRNISRSEILSSDQPALSLVDPDGRHYQSDPTTSLAYDLQQGEVDSGNIESGTVHRSGVVFIVPSHAFDQTTWTFDVGESGPMVSFQPAHGQIPKWAQAPAASAVSSNETAPPTAQQRSTQAPTAPVAVPASPAPSPLHLVRIINSTRHTMEHFFVSNIHTNSWQDDLLSSAALLPGQSEDINIDDGTGACEFDFKAVFDDNQQLIRRDVNVCSINSYRYTE